MVFDFGEARQNATRLLASLVFDIVRLRYTARR